MCTKIASNIETKVYYRAVTRGIYTKDCKEYDEGIKQVQQGIGYNLGTGLGYSL